MEEVLLVSKVCGRANLSQLRKQRFFDVDTLRRGFNHQICRGERFDIRYRQQPGKNLAASIGGKFSASHPGGETLADPVNRA